MRWYLWWGRWLAGVAGRSGSAGNREGREREEVARPEEGDQRHICQYMQFIYNLNNT